MRTLFLFLVVILLAGLSTTVGSADVAEINDAEIYYEIHGKGDPLLLLHGFSGSGQVFAAFLENYATAIV